MEPTVLPTPRALALGTACAEAPAPFPQDDPTLAAIAHALRGARARTGMSEQQVVAKLAENGFAITVARLRVWERTGVMRVDAASRLADAYGITMDSLAGRRAYTGSQHSAS